MEPPISSFCTLFGRFSSVGPSSFGPSIIVMITFSRSDISRRRKLLRSDYVFNFFFLTFVGGLFFYPTIMKQVSFPTPLPFVLESVFSPDPLIFSFPKGPLFSRLDVIGLSSRTEGSFPEGPLVFLSPRPSPLLLIEPSSGDLLWKVVP